MGHQPRTSSQNQASPHDTATATRHAKQVAPHCDKDDKNTLIEMDINLDSIFIASKHLNQKNQQAKGVEQVKLRNLNNQKSGLC
jgi:hypothetical protein